MQRRAIEPRPDWQTRVARVGLTFHTLAHGSPYWDESAYWEFTAAEIDRLEAATAEIERLALHAADCIVREDRFAEMGIPEEAVTRIRESWTARPPCLYGRLDLAFDGRQIKLLEYNADTPTALVEAAVVQWYWLRERFPEADQFNSLHERLVAQWKHLLPCLSGPIYFGHADSEEDYMTVTYLRETAGQAGHGTCSIRMEDIGWEPSAARLVDLAGQPIRSLFKLYPWEWLLAEPFGRHLLALLGTPRGEVQWDLQCIEPIWKMMWANKALLAVLWELNPGHELLLPAYLDGPRELTEYVSKPLFGREGAGVTIFRDDVPDFSPSDEPVVYQALAPIAQAGGNYAVLGSWLIDGTPAGIGIRESTGMVTTNTSRFVPHLFR